MAPYLPVRIRKLLGQEESVKDGKDEPMDVIDGAGDNLVGLVPTVSRVYFQVSSTPDDANVKRAERIAREQRGLGFIATGVDSLVIASRSVGFYSSI